MLKMYTGLWKNGQGVSAKQYYGGEFRVIENIFPTQSGAYEKT